MEQVEFYPKMLCSVEMQCGFEIKQMILMNISSFHSQGYLVVNQMPLFFFISKVYFYHETWSFQSNLNSFTKPTEEQLSKPALQKQGMLLIS